jgi:hypothetical protein
MVTEPQYVFGAAMFGCTCAEKLSQQMRPIVVNAKPWKAEKMQKTAPGG